MAMRVRNLSSLKTLNPIHGNEIILLERKKKNDELIVNRLPHEVLSRIMLIGVESDHIIWRWGSRNIQSQQNASHVCSHWRAVAISAPLLWTFIHITSSVPSEYVALYLTRAGSTALLEIAIDLLSAIDAHKYNMDQSGVNVDQKYAHTLFGVFFDILGTLGTQGAQTIRWRSLLVRINQLYAPVLPYLISGLATSPVPNLQQLRFDYHGDAHWDGFRQFGVERSEGWNSEGTSLSSSLHCLELVLPYSYEFGSTWVFTKLKELTIISSYLNPSGLSNLLLSNLQLESLCLGDGNSSRFDRIPLVNPELRSGRCTEMPSLRSLSIHTYNDASWALRILTVIRATGLRRLSLKYAVEDYEDVQNLVTYIQTGFDLTNPMIGSVSGHQSIYPSAQSLDISYFMCHKVQWVMLVSSFPELTHLVVREQQFILMNESLWLFPQLEYLGVMDLPVHAEVLLNYLPRRVDACGLPIKEVKAQGGRLRLRASQPDPLGLAEHHPSVPPAYEYYYQYDEDTTMGDLQSLERQSASGSMFHRI
ncbi:unnamed protein product [Rhizoctonia solani]|uniref:F-box domain-containing protein n=1 Tax=Rhizoctonia solani TaxID=456999 RepID=A0A8H2XKA6_9AGAM|nr:unnamed protein product [Rhizoctonia solani]